MNDLNRIRAFAAYKGVPVNLAAQYIAKQCGTERLKFPCALTIRNLRTLVSFHQGEIDKYAFHMPTRSLAIGNWIDTHAEIAEKVIDHPDVKAGKHENVLDGSIFVGPGISEKGTRLIVNGLSGSNDLSDPIEAFNFILGLARDEAAGFGVLSQYSGTYPASAKQNCKKPYYSFVVEDKFPLK